MKQIISIIWGLALVLGLCACGQTASGQATSGQVDGEGELTWQEQYDLGLRYLEDGNYEEAIIAFTAAIEIDPQRAEAYVGRGDAYVGYAQTLAKDGVLNDDALEAYENAIKDYRTAIRRDKTDVSVYEKAAEVYVILGDTDSAVELIEKGLRATEDQSLQDLLDKLAGVVPADNLTEGSAERQALEDFLWNFNWYDGDYDCETAAIPAVQGGALEPQTVLEKMLVGADGSCYCYDDRLYPGERMGWVEGAGEFEPDSKVNAARLDWILEHIFNCSKTDIQKMKEPILAGQNERIQYLDGYYYFWVGGLGTPLIDISITKIEPVGMRYYVEYYFHDPYDDYDNAYPVSGFYSAMVSLKEIDGEKYWSLYYNRYNQTTDGGGTQNASSPPEEVYTGSLSMEDYTSIPAVEAYTGSWSGDAEMYITGVDVDHISCEVSFYRLCYFELTGVVDLSGRIALYDETSDVHGELVLAGDQITLTLEDVPNFYFDHSLSEFLGGTQFVFYRE